VKQQEFTNLLNKYLGGTADAQEQQTLINYYNALQENNSGWSEDELGIENDVRQDLLNKINNEITFIEKKTKSKRTQWLSIAASLFVIIGLGSYFLVNPNKILKNKKLAQVSIKPGGNKAILTLDNGKQIILNEAKNGEIARQDDIVITKTEDGKLVYNIMENNDNVAEVQAYNTITTPRGGQYQVSLPDGTKVWLNAGSSLKYPAKFAYDQRTVELKGEGYFEVAKDKSKPFMVVTTNQKIEVFGTHFNVNAYDDEPAVKTTLLEGSVKVYQASTFISKFIKPGQQAILTAKSFNIQDVDVEEAVDWKNGVFSFNEKENIKVAMRKLARWYDVEMDYEGDFNDISFGGSFSRFSDITESIKILESTNKFKCKIVGRRILIKR